MSVNKLTEVLSRCKKEEIPALHDFVNSPFFNKDKAITKLLCSLIEVWPEVPESKTALFGLAYPGAAFEDKRFRYLISNAAKLVLRFWTVSKYEAAEPRKLLDELDIALARNLEKHYRQGIRKWKVLYFARDKKVIFLSHTFHFPKGLAFTRITFLSQLEYKTEKAKFS